MDEADLKAHTALVETCSAQEDNEPTREMVVAFINSIEPWKLRVLQNNAKRTLTCELATELAQISKDYLYYHVEGFETGVQVNYEGKDPVVIEEGHAVVYNQYVVHKAFGMYHDSNQFLDGKNPKYSLTDVNGDPLDEDLWNDGMQDTLAQIEAVMN